MATTDNRYCPSCGTKVRTDDRFCPSCGKPLVIGPTYCPECGAQVATTGGYCGQCGASLTITQPLAYRLSTERVVLMSVLSWGLYLFYWFYLTWKQYRDCTKEEAYPIWHALSLVVPIYAHFRMHAHVRSFKELMSKANIETTLAPGSVVIGLVTIWILGGISAGVSYSEPITKGAAVTTLLLEIVAVFITAWLISHVQQNLNRYWNSLSDSPSLSSRVGIGEVVFAVIGVLAWLNSIAMVFSESYRLG